MFVIGLTGGVGSGKSTVADLFAAHGTYLIDADVVAREVVAAKSPGLGAIIAHFGREFLTSDGELDRPRLATEVFGNPDKLAALNAITHPLVRASIAEQLEALEKTNEIVLLSVPLMIESRNYAYDVLVVVDVDEDTAVERVVSQRHWTPESARARIHAQAAREERIDAADYVIDNSGTPTELAGRVESAWKFVEEQRAIRSQY